MNGLRVALLGAAGTIAPAIVADLADSDEVSELLLLDLDAERAAAVAERHGGGKATARAADARSGLDAVLGGDRIDVLVNAASYRINLDAMRACLRAGCHYVDLGGLYHVTLRQLELDDDFRAAGRLALLGIGSSPGKTNVMAARAVAELRDDDAGEQAIDAIDVSAAGRDPLARDALTPPYALQTLIDELTLAPVVLRDGEPVEIDPVTAGGTLDFGEPIGEAETIYTLHSELATFGPSFGCAAGSFRLSLATPLLDALRELAQAPPERQREAARSAQPQSAETVSVHLVQVRSGDRTVSVRATTRPHRPFAMGGSVVSTAAPAAAAVRMLARGQLAATGALPPERCIEPELLFDELRLRSCQFEVKEEVAA